MPNKTIKKIKVGENTYEIEPANQAELDLSTKQDKLPNASSSGKVLKSTDSAGGVEWADAGIAAVNENTFVFSKNMLIGTDLGKYHGTKEQPVTIDSANKQFVTVWNDIFDIEALPPQAYLPAFNTSVTWSNNSDTFGGKVTPTLTVSISNVNGSSIGYYKYAGGTPQNANLTWKEQDNAGYCKLQVYSDSTRQTLVETLYAGTATSTSFTFNLNNSTSIAAYNIDSTSRTLYFKLYAEYNESSVIPKDNLNVEYPDLKISAGNISNNSINKSITSKGKITFTAPSVSVSNTGNISEYVSAIIPAKKRYFTVTLTEGNFSTTTSGGSATGYVQPSEVSYKLTNGSTTTGTGTFSNKTYKIYTSESSTETAESTAKTATLSEIGCNYSGLGAVTFKSANGYTITGNATNISGWTTGGTATGSNSSMTLQGTKISYSDLYTLPTFTIGSGTSASAKDDKKLAFSVSSGEYGTTTTPKFYYEVSGNTIKYNSSGSTVNSDSGATITKYLNNTVTTASSPISIASCKLGDSSQSAKFKISWTAATNTVYTNNGYECPNAKNAFAASSKEETVSGTPNSGTKYVYWAKTSNTNTPSTWTKLGSGTTSVVDMLLTCAADEYLWVAATDSKSSFYEWNDASGKYNDDPTATTKSASTISIVNSLGVTVPGYYTYRTTNARVGATNKKFKLA